MSPMHASPWVAPYFLQFFLWEGELLEEESAPDSYVYAINNTIS